MAEYIEREAFLADKKWLYCTDCDKRKGKKRGKMITLYEIGEAPCKSCGIHDMLEEVEEYPAADVRPVVLCRECVNYGEMLSGYDHRLICHKFALTTKPNFYCACGERRNCGADMREVYE